MVQTFKLVISNGPDFQHDKIVQSIFIVTLILCAILRHRGGPNKDVIVSVMDNIFVNCWMKSEPL